MMCSIHYTVNNNLGEYLRCLREEKQQSEGNKFSLRSVASRVGIEPSYLSKIERGLEPRPSEETTRALAKELDEDADVLLAMAGKVSSDLQKIIRKRPQLFAQLIRELKNMPDRAVLRLVREVRDGNW
jgi:HTH-type transcriptional regulator, competence development regulator